MAQKTTVALEDDLDGGPADETVRFGIGGSEYEIDLSKKTPGHSAGIWHPSSTMPARLAGDRGAGPGVLQQAVSAAAISGLGRKTMASRSATAGASPRASLSSTKPGTKGEPDPSWSLVGPNQPRSCLSPIPAQIQRSEPPSNDQQNAPIGKPG